MYRAIAIALCSVTFFLIAFVIPVKAEHPFTTNLVCTTYDAGIEATRYAEASALGPLFEKARMDPDFECYEVEIGYAYQAVEIVHTYRADGKMKVMVLAIDGNGDEVYTFGLETYVRGLLHLADERGGVMTTEEMAASLARIEAQGVATHDRLGELRDDLMRHAAYDDKRFEKLHGRVTRGAVRQGWMLGLGVGVIAFANWAKDHLTF